MTPFEAQTLLAKVKGTDESVLGFYMDWKDVADALETIAGMQCIYAVQNNRRKEWLYDTSRHGMTHNHTLAHWYEDLEDARDEAATCYNDCNTRIVRRLVADPEVTE